MRRRVFLRAGLAKKCLGPCGSALLATNRHGSRRGAISGIMTCSVALSRRGGAIPRRSTDLRRCAAPCRRRQPQRTHPLDLGDPTADQTTSAPFRGIPSTLPQLLLRCGQLMPSIGQLIRCTLSAVSAIFQQIGAERRFPVRILRAICLLTSFNPPRQL